MRQRPDHFAVNRRRPFTQTGLPAQAEIENAVLELALDGTFDGPPAVSTVDAFNIALETTGDKMDAIPFIMA